MTTAEVPSNTTNERGKEKRRGSATQDEKKKGRGKSRGKGEPTWPRRGTEMKRVFLREGKEKALFRLYGGSGGLGTAPVANFTEKRAPNGENKKREGSKTRTKKKGKTKSVPCPWPAKKRNRIASLAGRRDKRKSFGRLKARGKRKAAVQLEGRKRSARLSRRGNPGGWDYLFDGGGEGTRTDVARCRKRLSWHVGR